MPGRSNTSYTLLSKSAFIIRLVYIEVLFNLLFIALAGVFLYHQRTQDETVAKLDTQNICQVLEQNIIGIIKQVDLGLFAIKDEYERQLAGGINTKALNTFIYNQLGRLPQLDSLRIADSIGSVNFGTGVDPSAHVTAVGRDYFDRLRNDPHAELVISKPVLGRISHKWVVILARRLNYPDGSFAGVVYGPILLETLNSLFTKINLGKDSVISLRDEQMGLITRHPESGAPGTAVGERPVSKELQKLLAEGRKSATYYTPTGTDNIARLVTYRKVENYPLHIIVGISRQMYLAEWWVHASQLSVFVLIVILSTVFVSRTIYRARNQEQRAIDQLMQQEEKYRIVADFTFAWEFWIAPDGKNFTYCSPSCRWATGRDAAEFYADSGLLLNIVHPDDKALFSEHRHEVSDGTIHADTLIFRIIHTEGDVRWIEHVCRPVIDNSGIFQGVRGSNRDITERIQAEKEREKAFARIRRLEGIIPICMYCKKIRDDQDSWQQMEKYITENSEAQFSHGMCPTCAEEQMALLKSRKAPA
ncbi:MAG: PAS domain-containing protein [Desulfuromonadaceae bacterium]|nr:PAS domain-containing protein [Desulfuromonadaceae bacterium]